MAAAKKSAAPQGGAEAPTTAAVDWDDVFSSDTEDEESAEAKAQSKAEEAAESKEEGNRLLREGLYAEAKSAYKRGLALVWAWYKQSCTVPRTQSTSGSKQAPEAAKAAGVGLLIDLNLSLCHLKLEDYKEAHRCASRVLIADPENSKALYRRGLAASRLDLLDAAAEDFSKVVRQEPAEACADARRELEAVQQRIVDAKGSLGRAGMQRGFLHSSSSSTEGATASDGAPLCGEGGPPAEANNDAEEAEAGEEEAEAKWVFASQVQEALQEVEEYLLAITDRRIVCDSEKQLADMQEHMGRIHALFPEVRRVIDSSVIDPPNQTLGSTWPSESPVPVQELLSNLAADIEASRLGFQSLAKREGEFDSLRVCRELIPVGEASFSSFDVEMLRWGTADASGPFAAPLFPPTGQPPDAATKLWQREVLHRYSLWGVTPRIARSVWQTLRFFLQQGIPLAWEGKLVSDVALMSGFFFREALAEGPEPPKKGSKKSKGEASTAAVKPQNRSDSLGLCSGVDNRLLLLPSFGSLGLRHAWLALQCEPAQDQTEDHFVFVDVCPGSLGLLPESSLAAGQSHGSIKVWSDAIDHRFVAVEEAWAVRPSASAAAALDTSSLNSPTDGDWESLLRLVFGLAMKSTSKQDQDQDQDQLDPCAGGYEEAGNRLQQAAARLGLPSKAPRVEKGLNTLDDLDEDDIVSDSNNKKNESNSNNNITTTRKSNLDERQDFEGSRWLAIEALAKRKWLATGMKEAIFNRAVIPPSA